MPSNGSIHHNRTPTTTVERAVPMPVRPWLEAHHLGRKLPDAHAVCFAP
jgi:hypothetical protein